MITVKEANINDLDGLLSLLRQLNNNIIEKNDKTIKTWLEILSDTYLHVFIAKNEVGKIVGTASLTIIPNLAHKQMPYAIVENVVIDNDYRRLGIGSEILNIIRTVAIKNNCYKITLATGHREVIPFYLKNGYTTGDKETLILWLD